MPGEDAPRASTTKGGRGKKRVKVLHPTDEFVVEGVPTVTAEGTVLSADEVKKVQAAAEEDPSIRLVVEDGDDE